MSYKFAMGENGLCKEKKVVWTDVLITKISPIPGWKGGKKNPTDILKSSYSWVGTIWGHAVSVWAYHVSVFQNKIWQ